MSKLSGFLCKCSLFVLIPVAANAAGTYYTGGYQSPQTRYNSSAFSNNTAARSTAGVSSYNQARYNSAGYNTSYNSSYSNRYAQNSRTANQSRSQQYSQMQPGAQSGGVDKGFYIDAGLAYKMGTWQFDMNSAGSKLHYDNLSWGVFDIQAGYTFSVGNTKMVFDAGFEYGMQLGESTMIDDDITNGGFMYAEWPDDTIAGVNYAEYLHSLSIGTTKDGDMLGLRAGIGLKDFFTWGRVKVTPSIGWRHLNYKLETTNNYGSTIATVEGNDGCVSVDGMTQCWPAIAFFHVVNPGTQDAYAQYSFGKFQYIDMDGDEYADVIGIPLNVSGEQYVDVPESLYFHQSDVSHSYDVTWTGPYLAMDMLYDINVHNSVTARVELGLPMYKATADQPYRTEWQHPKSIEDTGDFGSAIHFGLGANWRTALTDKVSLSLGVTYDYYNVSNATADTYLNPEYYQAVYNSILSAYIEEFGQDNAENYMLNGFKGDDGKLYAPDYEAVYINDVRNNGWKDTMKDEINSFFQSLGVRVGLNIRF